MEKNRLTQLTNLISFATKESAIVVKNFTDNFSTQNNKAANLQVVKNQTLILSVLSVLLNDQNLLFKELNKLQEVKNKENKE